jgi:ornithine cyclodeaminase/alanine dehydrogenase-like protein (mu-crystallin family)
MPGDARTVRIIRNVDVRDLVSWAAALDAIEESYRQLGDGHWVMSPRETLASPRTQTSLKVLPGLLPEHSMAGVSIYTGGNKDADAALQKCTLLFDTADGGLRAIVESDRLSWLRTGASGAVATRHLARGNSSILGILGTGRQARAQLLAHTQVMDVAEVVVFSRRPELRQVFADEMSASAAASTASSACRPISSGTATRRATALSIYQYQ